MKKFAFSNMILARYIVQWFIACILHAERERERGKGFIGSFEMEKDMKKFVRRKQDEMIGVFEFM